MVRSSQPVTVVERNGNYAATPPPTSFLCAYNVSLHFARQVEPAATSFFSQLGRRIYVSAKSYLDFLNMFLTMLRERRRALSTRLARQVLAGNGTCGKSEGCHQ